MSRIADARTGSATADSLRSRLGERARGSHWEAGVREGRKLLAAITMRSSLKRPFDDAASFIDARGASHSLADVVSSPISVVAFVSRYCAPSVQDLAKLSAVAARLRATGIPVTVLTQESPSAATVKSLSSNGYTGDIGFDDRGLVSRRLRQAGTPQYFVVENGSVIRFSARTAEQLVAQVEALRASRSE